MPMRPAKVMHIADVHLGLAGPSGGGLEELAFVAAIDLAIKTRVDAVLIVGDLFDHARVKDVLLDWTAKQLARLECPVVLLVGNHDTLHDESVHHRFRITDRCPHVALVDDHDGQIVDVPGTDIAVWGRAMASHDRSFRPLAGVPDAPPDRWAVVAAHGLVVGDDATTHHASPMRQSEIDAIGWHYVALGHHHGHKIVRDGPKPVVYPGATARSLHGQPGAVLVSFCAAGTNVEWVKLDLGI